ncbi:MAG TPA: protealysin inhibitor emfourin [Jatrophihabitans sp.]|jgi:hypothetical protein|nr:protealysin inhibitor emfourin [Jatrophihabitans sp.]
MTQPASAAPRVTVRVQVDGGFAAVPGLAGPFDVDTDRLDPGAAASLRRLLSQADFFARPAEPADSAPGAADVRTYTITATAEGREHTVRVRDPIGDAALARLVQEVTARR